VLVHVHADLSFTSYDVRLHEAAANVDTICELSSRGAERVRNGDVDVLVAHVRGCDLGAWNFEHDADVELAAVAMTLVRLRDRDAALCDAVVHVLEARNPALDGRLDRR
jgi:hypothetical protein